ncbi:MAG: sodium:proton exchanger [Spirochaetae bacterium HGW-Spirochaetae-4]|nr:MAG: sodium:proton exchanger [Spirochaetae bacterium HGW-Spirochaetae-4]
MQGQVHNLFLGLTQIHINILLLLGFALSGGAVCGRLFQKMKIPQVVGYIVMGIILGETGIKFIDMETIIIMQPFNYFALGLIGFTIGGSLNKETFVKYGRQVLYIMFSESMAAFFSVSFLTAAAAYFVTADWKTAVSLGILLGAISSATAPAVTSSIIWEYKTRGALTSTVLGIVAMDDAVALALFAIAASVAETLLSSSAVGIAASIMRPVFEIAGSLVLGSAAGLALSSLLGHYHEEDRRLAFSLGAVLLVLGLSLMINVDILLSAMVMGIVVTNVIPRKSKEAFAIVGKFAPPIYILFFVLFGVKLKISNITPYLLGLSAVYFFARTGGKMFGARFGAALASSTVKVKKYIPYCLFSQAGVAIGFSIMVAHRFPGNIGDTIVIIITLSTLFVELIGPVFAKRAFTRSGEAGLNITEEDLMVKSKVRELMDTDIPMIYAETPLRNILKIFSEHTNLYYPVIDKNMHIKGVVTINSIRDTFMASELNNFLLAFDLMTPVVASVGPDDSAYEAKKICDKYYLECLPVIDAGNKVIGVIEARAMRKLISRQFMEMQKKAEE